LAALAPSKIVLVPLPTYAPWTNPVEKVWRKLCQEVLHLHEFVDE
jgi:transposase